MKKDLHIHTIHSDGEKTVSQIVEMVKKAGVREFAITDHDTIGGDIELKSNEKLLKELAENNIKFRAGIEISTYHEGKKFHILGLDIDINNPDINNLIKNIIEGRKKRAILIFDKLKKDFGIELKKEDMEALKARKVLGKPHIAEVLVRDGYAEDIEAAFRKYLKKIEVHEGKISVQEAISIIHKAGGIAVWAHPKTLMADYNLKFKAVLKTLKDFIRFGLDGLETKHSCHTEKEYRKFRYFARHFNLIQTCGSDYHGEVVLPGVELGNSSFQQFKYLNKIKK